MDSFTGESRDCVYCRRLGVCSGGRRVCTVPCGNVGRTPNQTHAQVGVWKEAMTEFERTCYAAVDALKQVQKAFDVQRTNHDGCFSLDWATCPDQNKVSDAFDAMLRVIETARLPKRPSELLDPGDCPSCGHSNGVHRELGDAHENGYCDSPNCICSVWRRNLSRRVTQAKA